jgi:HD-GYP domain-containing protein (c-di-GMP phosphodiesterase class II)
VQGFQDYLAIVELHHENWNGTGYPWGLRGEATPLGPRIVHVADAYDAMTSDRPYRRGMSPEQAIRVLRQYAGTQFDPAIVPVFANLLAFVLEPEVSAGPGRVHVLPRAVNDAPGATSV